MSTWKGKSRGGSFGHHFFVFVLKHSNLGLAYFFLRFVAAYFFFFAFGPVKSLFTLYRRQLKYGFFKTLFSIYQNFYSFGQVLLDKVALFNGYTNGIQHHSVGASHILELVTRGQGGILICSHVGGWELSGLLLEEIGPKPKIFMLEAEHEKIRRVLTKDQTKQAFDIISITNDLAHVLELAKCLRKKELIAIHGDRFIEGSKTIRLPFLGRPADFPLGPFLLAVKFNVPVSFVFTTRLQGKNYRCFASELITAERFAATASEKEKTRLLAQHYVDLLEQIVRHCPDQWFNYYDFWKSAEDNDHR